MSEKKSLLGSGLGMMLRNKRYIVWFFLLNLLLGLFGTFAFVNQAGPILEHSLQSDRLLHGFSLGVLIDMFARPEFGPISASQGPALLFSVLFLVFTIVFLPGVFQGYASTYRLPREDFFRACGRNLWRYIRILIVAGIVMGIAAGVLFAINGAIVKKAGDGTNELLPVWLQVIGLAVIFVVMTTLRIWFDLAEADAVLNDQRAVRKSIAAAFRHTFRNLGQLLGSYLVTTIVAILFLACGLWVWMKSIAPESVGGAFLVGQLTLLLLLIPRFWQRGVIVSYWQQHMMIPVVVVAPRVIEPQVIEAQPVPLAVPIPIAPSPTSEPSGA
jgi:hypothetical protein